MTTTLKRGTVDRISSRMCSGLAVVYFEDGSQVFIDSGMGVRQLYNAIEDKGSREIFYMIDEFNLMVCFSFEDLEK